MLALGNCEARKTAKEAGVSKAEVAKEAQEVEAHELDHMESESSKSEEEEEEVEAQDGELKRADPLQLSHKTGKGDVTVKLLERRPCWPVLGQHAKMKLIHCARFQRC